MGMPSGISKGSDSRTWPKAPNPNPARFIIVQAEQVGDALVLGVDYPDCTNFEGRKIMVLANTTENQVRFKGVLDPHFTEDGNVLARFRPDQKGWNAAIKYAESLPSRKPKMEGERTLW